MSATQLALLTALTFVTAAVGAVTGGNSLVNVPAMIWFGMSSREAVATNMFGVFFMAVSSTARFARERLISMRLALPLCGATMVSSALGAALAVELPEAVVKTIVGVSMVLLVAFMLLRPVRAHSTPAAPNYALGFPLAFALGVYGGLFSGGYTTLMTVLGVACFGLTMLQSVALMKAVNLASCAAACVLFVVARIVDFRVGVAFAAANLLGGYVGAHFAVRIRPRLLRLLFLATVACLAAKVLVYDVIYRSFVLREPAARSARLGAPDNAQSIPCRRSCQPVASS